MTTITYRGQQYDKEAYKAAVLEEQTQKQNHNLMYRGIKSNVSSHLRVDSCIVQ